MLSLLLLLFVLPSTRPKSAKASNWCKQNDAVSLIIHVWLVLTAAMRSAVAITAPVHTTAAAHRASSLFAPAPDFAATADYYRTTDDAAVQDGAEVPLYGSYVSGADNMAATVITRNQMEQLRLRADGLRQRITSTGFTPTTLTAAGRHYAAGAASANDNDNRGDGVYAQPAAKIDYESGAENFEGGDEGAYALYGLAAPTPSRDSSATQHQLADGAAGSRGHVDVGEGGVDSFGSSDAAYFDAHTQAFKNYFFPTYGVEQFSSYNQPTHLQHQQQERQLRQQAAPQALHDAVESAEHDADVLQQFNKRANIENHANDEQQQQVRYYTEQPHQQLQHLQQLQQLQQLQLQQHSAPSSATRSTYAEQAVEPTRLHLQVVHNAGRSVLSAKSNLHADSSSSRSNSITSDNTNPRHNGEPIADSRDAQSQFYYTHRRPHRSHVDGDTHNGNDNVIDDKHNDDSDILHNQYPQLSHATQHLPALPPITTTVHHTHASAAAVAGVPLGRHVEVTRYVPTVQSYERQHVPFNQTVPIQIPRSIVAAIPRPYPIHVPIHKTIAVPQIKEIRIPIEKVKPFAVERPVPFIVERRVPFPVEKQVAQPVYYPYPIRVPVIKTIVHKAPSHGHAHVHAHAHNPHAHHHRNLHPHLSLTQYHSQHSLPLHYHAGHLG